MKNFFLLVLVSLVLSTALLAEEDAITNSNDISTNAVTTEIDYSKVACGDFEGENVLEESFNLSEQIKSSLDIPTYYGQGGSQFFESVLCSLENILYDIYFDNRIVILAFLCLAIKFRKFFKGSFTVLFFYEKK